MNCREIASLLSPYIDQALGAGEERAVKLHLAECAQCRQELASLKEVVYALRTLGEVEPPAEFAVAWRQRLRGAGPSSPGRFWPGRLIVNSWMPLGATAAVILMVALSINLWSGAGMKSEAPTQLTRAEFAQVPVADSKNMTDQKTAQQESRTTANENRGLLSAPAPASETATTKSGGMPSDSASVSATEGSYLSAEPPTLASRQGVVQQGFSVAEAPAAQASSPGASNDYERRLTQTVLAVDDAQRATEEIGLIAGQAGGRVVPMTEAGAGVITLRVPTKGLDDLLRSIEGLGEVKDLKTSVQDMAAEIAEQERLLKDLSDEATRLETSIKSVPDEQARTEQEARQKQVQADIPIETDKLNVLKSEPSWATVEITLVSP